MQIYLIYSVLLDDTVNCYDHVVPLIDDLMHVRHLWNDIDRGKPEYWETNLSYHHIVHCKSHMTWPWNKPRSPGSCLTTRAMAWPMLKIPL